MVKVLHWAGRLKAAKDQRSAKDGCLPSGNQAGHLEIPKGNGGFRLKSRKHGDLNGKII